jgi:hypothetical protein
MHVAPWAPPRPRWRTALLIIALHVAGLLCWPAPDSEPGMHGDPAVPMIWVAPLREERPAATETVAARTTRTPRPTPARAVPRKEANEAPSISLVPAEPVSAEPVPSAPHQTAEEMTAQAKRDIGKIDRELRKASLDMAQRNLVFNVPLREKAIAGAYVERGPPKIIEEVMSDGRRRSRIGNMCAYMESNGLVGARDVFKNGVRTLWVEC